MGYLVVGIGLLVGFYLFCIMPKCLKRGDYAQFKDVFYAHRGLHDNESLAPENSLKSFELAVAAGYGIELDVRKTLDDVLVVFHDESLKRMCGVEGLVQDKTYAQLQEFTLGKSLEKIPTLDEVLCLVDGAVPLIVEIKMKKVCGKLCVLTNEALKGYKGLYAIESFHPYAVYWYRVNQPDVVRGQLATDYKAKFGKRLVYAFVMKHLLTNFVTKPDFIAYCHKYPDNLSRSLCQNFYKSLGVAWTIKSQADLDACRHQFDLFIFEGFIPQA